MLNLSTMAKVKIIRKEVDRIEQRAEQLKAEHKWQCWKCDTINSYADGKTQVIKDECCVHVCRECGADEIPF